MAQQLINIGTTANDGTGDPLRTALDKTNDNFTELYTTDGLKAPIASPTFTGTVAGITKSMVGLGNVDNTADAAKPVSTAQQTALDLKVTKAGDTMGGNLAMGSNKVTGLGAATTNGDAVRYEQVITLAPAETTTTEGALINGATAKTTPVDADFIGLMDSVDSNILKKLSWANIKATLKTYFDTIYPIDEVDVVTTGSTITLDFAGKRERIFNGLTSFTGSKTIATTNDSNARLFTFNFEGTGSSVALTIPSNFKSSDSRKSGTVFTYVGAGLYDMTGTYASVSSIWKVRAEPDGGVS